MTTPDHIDPETLAEWSEDANRGDITDARWGTGTHTRDRRILALCAEVERLTRERDMARADVGREQHGRAAWRARAEQAERERDDLRARVRALADAWDAVGWDYPEGAAYDLRVVLDGEADQTAGGGER